jgi:hypothetical protein
MNKLLLISMLFVTTNIFASTTYYSDGSYSNNIGNTTWFSDGSYANQIGNTTWFSDGSYATTY